MLRLLSCVLTRSYRRPRIMNLNNLMKKQTIGKIQLNSTEKLSVKISQNEQQKQNDSISWKEVNNAINKSQETLSKQELQINRLIKIETKSSSLYELFKAKYSVLSAKNVVNLVIKMLQLRYINRKEFEQLDKLDKIVTFAFKKLHKMTPQDMIRFLFSLKTVDINISDFKRISNLIVAILREFTGRSFIKGYDTLKTFESFQVVSVQSTLKLIHSLEYLHSITGRQYEPQILDLIKQTLSYFHSFLESTLAKPHKNSRYIKWHFYFSLIHLLIRYEMPIQMVLDFLRVLYPLKKTFIGHYQKIVKLEVELTKMPVIVDIRGDKIAENRQLFHLHQIMFQCLEKPQQLIKIKPYTIMKHLESLNWFTDKQLSLLQYEKIKQSTFSKVVTFTLKTLQKYLTKDYSSQIQKSAVQYWVQDGTNNYQEYLRQFLLFFHIETQKSKLVNTNQYNKILNLCLEFYSELSFNSKAVLLYLSSERGFKNLKFIAEIFWNREETKNQTPYSKRVRSFAKYQQIESYIRLFGFWKEIHELSKFTFDQYRQGTFIKAFLRAMIHLPNDQLYPQLFAQRIQQQPQFLALFMKKYKKHSLENRALSKVFIDMVQQSDFKKELEQISQVLRNQKEDTFKLSTYSRLKHTIRQKMKRSLKIFKFTMMLLQSLKEKGVILEKNITESEYFVEFVNEFQQELQCLYFQQLYTLQIYELAAEISQYLKSKSDVKYRVSNIQKHGQELKVKLNLKQGQGLLRFIPQLAKKTKNLDEI